MTLLDCLTVKKSKVKHVKPAHPIYGIFENRLETFEKWPKSHKVSPIQLATAGFFFRPAFLFEDRVTCFYCDLNLFNWKQNDIPLQEHKLWTRNHHRECGFLEMSRDRDVRFQEEKLESSSKTIYPQKNSLDIDRQNPKYFIY